ncbi:MAG: DUF86 domain-containing protein [Candidatus Cloacimonetes bacterium]|nr:DUF86 domain-containing protein [Candidatus Cloacimonadota bacterium]
MNRDYKLFLEDILDSIKKIKKYVTNLSLEDFTNDEKTVDAVIRNFEIIGEASKNIPDEIQKKYNDIPWREMNGMRNILIHDYFGVDYNVIYKTVKEFLPDLKKKIQEIL